MNILEELQSHTEPIKVVGVMGHSKFSGLSKGKLMNCLLQRPVFSTPTLGSHSQRKALSQLHLMETSGTNFSASNLCSHFEGRNFSELDAFDFSVQIPEFIQLFFDPIDSILYLNLHDSHDFHVLSELIESEYDEICTKNTHEWLQKHEATSLKSALYLFMNSHHILCFNHSASLDWIYLKIFRTLSLAKQKLSQQFDSIPSHSSPHLKHAAQGWYRPLSKQDLFLPSPAISFLFLVPPFPLMLRKQWFDEDVVSSKGSSRGKSHNPLHRVQKPLESQLRKIFKKGKILPTDPNFFPLFSTKSSSPLCYIIPVCDHLVSLQDSTRLDSLWEPSLYLTKQIFQPKTKSRSKSEQFMFSATLDVFSSLREHLLGSQNINLHSAKLSSAQSKPLFFLADWMNSSLHFTSLFHSIQYPSPTAPPDTQTTPHSMADPVLMFQLDADLIYSNSLCERALPIAVAAYKEKLPKCYSSQVHHTALENALKVLLHRCRGPSVGKYCERLKEICASLWTLEKQLCETRSLTGRNCIHPVHKVSSLASLFPIYGSQMDFYEQDTLEAGLHADEEQLAYTPHESGFQSLLACNCGKNRNIRCDPFSLIDANYTFFKDFDCCAHSPSLSFPRLSDEKLCSVPRPLHCDIPVSFDFSYKLHSALPLFPSWSLVRIGDSCEYQPTRGLIGYEGFVRGSTFLLPWEFMIQSNSKMNPPGENLPKLPQIEVETPICSLDQNLSPSCSDACATFPAIYPSSYLRMKRSEPFKDKDSFHAEIPTQDARASFAVSCYIGYEYECPQGHRFFASSPERVSKGASTAAVKDVGCKVIASDMPIFIKCRCQQASGSNFAQLMRIHILTPDSPFHVCLNPKTHFHNIKFSPSFSASSTATTTTAATTAAARLEHSKKANDFCAGHHGALDDAKKVSSSHFRVADKFPANKLPPDELCQTYIFHPGFHEASGWILPPASWLVLRLPYVYSYLGSPFILDRNINPHLLSRIFFPKDSIYLTLPPPQFHSK